MLLFIPNSVERANSWANCASKCLKVDPLFSQQMMANLLRAQNWDALCKAIHQTPPKNHDLNHRWADEYASKDLIEERNAYYATVLTGVYGLSPEASSVLIRYLSPSAHHPQWESFPDKIVRLLNHTYQSELFVNENIVLNTEQLQELQSQGFNTARSANEKQVQNPSKPFVEEYKGNDLSNVYFDLFKYLGWNTVEESMTGSMTQDSNSFVVNDKQNVAIPVYISDLDGTEHMKNTYESTQELFKVRNHALANYSSGKAILIHSKPIVTSIDGFVMCEYGLYYARDRWNRFLLNENMSCVDRVLEQDSLSSDPRFPHPSLCDSTNSILKKLLEISNSEMTDDIDDLVKHFENKGWVCISDMEGVTTTKSKETKQEQKKEFSPA